jgi:hypothetical protein
MKDEFMSDSWLHDQSRKTSRIEYQGTSIKWPINKLELQIETSSGTSSTTNQEPIHRTSGREISKGTRRTRRIIN